MFFTEVPSSQMPSVCIKLTSAVQHTVVWHRGVSRSQLVQLPPPTPPQSGNVWGGEEHPSRVQATSGESRPEPWPWGLVAVGEGVRAREAKVQGQKPAFQ